MVINNEPTIIGKIPKLEGVFEGDQFEPNKNLATPYFPINGSPFINMKIQINDIATIDIAALRKNRILKNSSLNACFFTRYPF
ncbi:hypothetical protein SS13_contig00001-0075 [Streptococcus parauberis]|nr:hypothetical protein SS13_contig00001-0075 [Streptococcus parauberis]